MSFDILGFNGYNILDKTEDERSITLHIETQGRPLLCPKNGCLSDFYKHDTKKQAYADTTIHAKMVWLIIHRKRFKCRSCNETFYEFLPHMNEDRFMTERLVSYIERECLSRTHVSIANEIGINDKTVFNVFKDYANRLEGQYKFETPNVLGIDEIHILGSAKCVLTDIENRTVLDFLPNRKKEDLIPYLQQLPDKEKIEYVCMDIWLPYKDSCKVALPQATIIIDKFHIVRYANKAMEEIRKMIKKSLDKTKGRKLLRERFTLYKRKHSLTDKDWQKLRGWQIEFPELYRAYELKEEFFDIWDTSTDSNHARERYYVWCRSIPDEMLPKFAEMIRFLSNWEDVIFNYFDHPKRVTNAYTEGLNSLIRKANDIGRGYSFEVIRVKLLFSNGFRKKKQENVGRRFMMNSLKNNDGQSTNIKRLVYDAFPTEQEVEADYGVEFSTMVKALEEGFK